MGSPGFSGRYQKILRVLAFTTFLQQVKQTTLEAFEHQEVPFEKVVEAVVKERDTTRNPIFQVLFAW